MLNSAFRAKSFRIVVLLLTVGGLLFAQAGCKKKTKAPSRQKTATTRPAGERHSFRYDGPLPKQFQEAPELARRVAAGQLPPVKERLPAEPLVVPPVERIGKYGGTWRRAFTGPVDGQNIDRIVHDHIIYYDLDGQTILPHIAKSWDLSEDGRIMTLHLRKGMRWSDGHPFTADDFVFAHEELVKNDELNPYKPIHFKSAGKIGRVEKVGPHTVRHIFDEPYYILPEIYACTRIAGQFLRGRLGQAMYAPKHYLKQFHPNYISRPELDQKVKKAGLSHWRELFRLRSSALMNKDLPVVAPWKMVRPISGQLFTFERNPYYWAVDPEGNQLPYIDKISMRLAGNLEVLNLWAIAGELDMQARHIMLAKIPVLKNNRQRGNYRILLWPTARTGEVGIAFNQTWRGDPEIEKWLCDRDFRIAMSLAVDRDEINRSMFLGLAQTGPSVPGKGTPFYLGPKYDQHYTALDPAESNRMLDRLGLTKKDAEGFRLRTDGKGRLTLNIGLRGNAFVDVSGIAQLIAQHWAKVGITLDAPFLERSLFETRRAGNEFQLTLSGISGAGDLWVVSSQVPDSPFCSYAGGVGQWCQTGGKRGMPPAGDLKRLIEIHEKGKHVPRNERIDLGREFWRIIADNMYIIGVLGKSPASTGVVVVKNDFRNVPAVAPNHSVLQSPGPARPEQFFFDR